MTSEESNEWKWAVQNLDHIAKALLQCLDNKQLQLEIKSSDHQEAPVKIGAIGSGAQQKPSVEQQQCSESQDLGVPNAPSQALKEEASNCTETIQQERMISDVNIKELFLNAVKTGQWAKVKHNLNIDNATFLQIIDGGGQPSFQEIFPLLISGPSVTLLIFKLTDDLETSYTVQYQPESGSGGQKAWEDAYVVKDIISHAISSFASQKKTTAPVPCKILLVGTHKDKLGDASQDPHDSNKKAKIESTAEQLHGWLHQSKAFESIQVRSIEDFINSIDNNDENDIVSIRKKIEETISQLDSQDIPAPWLVFDFVLRKHAKQNELQKIAKRDCIGIASICGVKDDEVDVVLHYLHFEAGTLLYYSDIPTLNQCVITDFQLIFDSISKIIIQFFDDNSVNGPHMKYKNLLKQKGQLDASVLRDVQAPSFQPGLRNQLVKLEGVPTVKLLTSLPIPGDGAKRKNHNIIQKTSTCYTNLAMYLLDDDNCEIVDSLKEKCHGDPEEIVTAVYKKWISGTGRKPVTWQTLLDVLREIELNSLAEEIETALN
eukprot:Em0007g239a